VQYEALCNGGIIISAAYWQQGPIIFFRFFVDSDFAPGLEISQTKVKAKKLVSQLETTSRTSKNRS